MIRNRKLHPILIGLLIAVFILLLPLTLPVGLIIWWMSERHAKKKLLYAAQQNRCEKCGSILGSKSLQLANTEWKNRLLELSTKYPTVRFRLVRTLHAICAKCGTRYSYFNETQTLSVEKLDASASWRKKMLGNQ